MEKRKFEEGKKGVKDRAESGIEKLEGGREGGRAGGGAERRRDSERSRLRSREHSKVF